MNFEKHTHAHTQCTCTSEKVSMSIHVYVHVQVHDSSHLSCARTRCPNTMYMSMHNWLARSFDLWFFNVYTCVCTYMYMYMYVHGTCKYTLYMCVCVCVCVCVGGGGGGGEKGEGGKDGERDSSRVWEALVSIISAWLLGVCIGFV